LGQRADFLVLDPQSSALLGVPPEYTLDALVFSSPDARLKDVFVAGNQHLAAGRVCGPNFDSELWPQLAREFVSTMKTLWV
jgi:formimidoylglutamate deiminase